MKYTIIFPSQQSHNVESMLNLGLDVNSTLIKRSFNIVCLLGHFLKIYCHSLDLSSGSCLSLEQCSSEDHPISDVGGIRL
jgi:hypothetical protein